MRLAFSSVMLGELPIEEVCAQAAKLGFEALGNLFPASGPATISFNGLHPKSKFLGCDGESLGGGFAFEEEAVFLVGFEAEMGGGGEHAV